MYCTALNPHSALTARPTACRRIFPEMNASRPDADVQSVLKTISSTAFGIAASFLLQSSPALARETVVGTARVIDGDTIEVSKTRIRLFGIDAPETKQFCSKTNDIHADLFNCGEASKTALEKKVGNSTIACEVKRKDIYGRSVGICSFASPKNGQPAEDINEFMVEEGYATAYQRYSKKYVAAEDAAKQAQKGLWSGTFEEPEAWRRGHPRTRSSSDNGSSSNFATAAAVVSTSVAPLVAPPPAQIAVQPAAAPKVTKAAYDDSPPSPDCVIKGNINAKKKKIYHVPGGQYYESTKIDSAGEKWFCSEKEALAAGWRKAQE